MDWAETMLPPRYIMYAALDADASLLVYKVISKRHTRPLLPLVLPRVGTQVAIMYEPDRPIALGIIQTVDSSIDEMCAPPPEFHGFKWDKSRAVVAITQILIPGALVPEYNTNRDDFPQRDLLALRAFSIQQNTDSNLRSQSGDGSFPLLFALDALVVDLDDEVTIESSVNSSAHTSTSAHKPSLSSAQISSAPKALDVGAVANSCTRETEMEEHTEDFDDSLDTATGEIEEALLLERCETTAAEISAILDAAEGNKASSLDDPQPRILMDPFHFFQRIYLSKKHGATRAFLRALSDAIYVVNLDDKHLMSIRLAKAMMTFDEATRSPAHAKYIWKRVRRTIPPPSVLEPLVREIFETFGSLLDAKTKQPLFNKAALVKVEIAEP